MPPVIVEPAARPVPVAPWMSPPLAYLPQRAFPLAVAPLRAFPVAVAPLVLPSGHAVGGV